jgi:hypothetical protein
MDSNAGKAVGGGCAGCILGCILGAVIAGSIGAYYDSIRPRKEGLEGLFDIRLAAACWGSGGAIVGAIFGSIVGSAVAVSKGGKKRGASPAIGGLLGEAGGKFADDENTRTEKSSGQFQAELGGRTDSTESPEEELVRLRKRVEELEAETTKEAIQKKNPAS